ncbi:MAG: hypothetical protein AAFR77_01510 [Cyanobacteria bacterium J06631_2]
MNQSKRKRIIGRDALEKIDQKLSSLEKKPQSEFNLRESIAYLADKLKSALNKGYSYEDLTEILSEQNISVSISMLRRYLKEAEENLNKSQKKPKSKKKPDRKITNNGDNVSSPGSNSELESNTSKTKTNNRKSGNKTSNSDYLPKDGSSNKPIENPEKAAVLSGINNDLSSEFNSY